MVIKMESKRGIFNGLERKLEEELDFDFSVSEIKIDDEESFLSLIKEPFDSEYYNKDRRIFYRGERVSNLSRPLMPTLLRDKDKLLYSNEPYRDINCEFLLDYYKNLGEFYNIFRNVFGTVTKYRLYELCAFAQHYLDISPFIDFTKSLYVALSFALKGREDFKDDIVLYTAEISDTDNYTNDIVTAECWLNSYNVTVYNSPQMLRSMRKTDLAPAVFKSVKDIMDGNPIDTSPKAKLIDIPTNDFTKYQQGVFLLLTDFSLIHRSYLTKNVRKEFLIKKYIISRDICPALSQMIKEEAPWYEYECLLDIKTAMRRAAYPEK